MVDRYFVGFDSSKAPTSSRTIYADGSAGSNFRPGIDLELSHWIPTTTPKRWAADTSTEICFRFLESDPEHSYELVVNNHIDVDGILSLFVLLQPELAALHRDTIVGAAEHGDLQASASRSAVILAQELTDFVGRAYSDGESMHDLYTEAFTTASAVLDQTITPSEASLRAWEQIERGHALIDSGEVSVQMVSPNLVSFVLPLLGQDSLKSALTVPPFNAVVDQSVWLWPHARNRHHGQRAHLVSIPTPAGWYHDLWLPGYSWAHTPDRWRFPGLRPSGGSNAWAVKNPALDQAIETLSSHEEQVGRWALVRDLTPFAALTGRGFPVVASFLDAENHPETSSLEPTFVAQALSAAFEG